jgi:amino acid transporter
MKNTGLSSLPKVQGHGIALTINLILLSIFYVVIGFLVSYLIGLFFPDYSEEWKKEPLWLRTADVTAEVSLLVVASFWVTYFARLVIPVIPLKPSLEHYLEQYAGNTMFVYAIFIFFDDLSDKLIFLFQGEPRPA